MDPPGKSPSFPGNNSPKLAWGSPAAAPPLRPVSTFPPMRTTPHKAPPVPSGFGGMQGFGQCFNLNVGVSPPHFRHTPPGSFRTPQPQPRSYSPNYQRVPWTDNRGNQRRQRFPSNQSPQNSPQGSPRHFGYNSKNRNGDGDIPISRYYKDSMVQDPWCNLTPVSANS